MLAIRFNQYETVIRDGRSPRFTRCKLLSLLSLSVHSLSSRGALVDWVALARRHCHQFHLTARCRLYVFAFRERTTQRWLNSTNSIFFCSPLVLGLKAVFMCIYESFQMGFYWFEALRVPSHVLMGTETIVGIARTRLGEKPNEVENNFLCASE